MKGKGEKIYPFECRVPNSKEREAFFSHQCKEIEEKNRMGKTRDLFDKIRDTKGTFHAKMGSIKDRNDKAPSLLAPYEVFIQALYPRNF